MKNSITAIALVAIVSGCAYGDSGNDGGSEIGVAKQAASITSGRTVPYPIVRKVESGGIAAVLDPLTNKPRIAWDASYTEMLVADEYAKCVAEFAGTDVPSIVPVGFYPDVDADSPAMERIAAAMSQGVCPRAQYEQNENGFPPAAIEWALRRSDPACNIDPATGESRAAIVLPDRDLKSMVADFVEKSNDASQNSSNPLSRFTCVEGSSYGCPTGPTYAYLQQADVSLCFAQRLNSLLEGADIFTATTQEHMLVLGLTYERAQDALMKLGYLLKLQQKSSADIPANNASGPAIGAMLRLWMDGSNDQVMFIRRKFLSALRLTGAASTTFASFLERQAGARWTTSMRGDAFGRDWGVGSARSRLLNLVYGGGALDDLWGIEDYNGWSIPWFSEVTSASADPRLMVLLGLARQADGLYFRPISSNGAVSLDPASWESLYLEAEVGLRVRYCVNSDATQCTKETQRSGLPPLSNPAAFWLRRDFGLTIDDAKKLSTALFEASVRHDMVSGDLLAATHGAFHLSGSHSETPPPGHAGETDWIKLDSGTILFPYAFEERAQWGKSVCSPATPSWDYPGYCRIQKAPGWGIEEHGRLGVVSSLGFAREVLFEQSGSTSDANLGREVKAALTEVERLAGSTTIVRRADTIDVIRHTGSNTTPELINPMLGGTAPGLKAAAQDRSYQGPNGIGRATLDGLAGTEGTTQHGSGEATGLERIRWVAPSANGWLGDSSLLLRGVGTSATAYTFVSETRAAHPTQSLEPVATVTTDGWFASLVSKVTAVQEADWSRPHFDGFGLPAQWVPPADASLLGGSAGEESYQYLLRSAKAAAEEATAAVKTAIDKLSEESLDASALQGAEIRAQAIGKLERTSLCGRTSTCKLAYRSVDFTVQNIDAECEKTRPSGTQDSGQRGQCKTALQHANAALGVELIPAVVADRLQSATETFDDTDYAGSELQRVLLRIWNASRLVLAAREQAARIAIAAGSEVGDLMRAYDVALAVRAAAYSQIDQLKDQYAGQVLEYRARLDAAYSRYANASLRLDQNCALYVDGYTPDVKSLPDFCREAMSEGRSCRFTGRRLGDGDDYGPANARCVDAWVAWKDAIAAGTETVKAVSQDIRKLDPSATMTREQLDAIADQQGLADAQFAAARTQQVSRLNGANVQTVAHLATIQQTVGERQSALAELRQLELKADQANERAELESDSAQWVTDSKSATRRIYRSYDLWRARALLESARRIAVAARRSIEARFVVDLSDLDTEQAFVASPSGWADEVYESDLNAPEAVGLSRAPKIEGAIYPNKLLDYVGNLERFVQGYTFTYPTSVSLPDTEVVALGAPDQEARGDGSTVPSLSPDTQGWRFYCAQSNKWIHHPGAGEYPLTKRIATACDGKPPTLAKIGFWLDPWGVLNGSWSRPQYTDRHNVRWRRLAVNLVGTGIRDCTKATDSMSCYTNPFVRFNLVHAGTSWQTNHSGEWRALGIPTAHIESGKALAAEEWLEPISNSWNMPYVANVARGELFGRPAAGNYELVLEVTPDVRLDRIERIQLLVEQDYWVKQTGGRGVYGDPTPTANAGAGGTTGAGGSSGSGGATSSGGTSSGGTTGSGGASGGAGGTTGSGLYGYCAPVGNDPRIEDFEDGNQIIGSYEQRLGRWFGFRAGTCTAVPPTNESFAPRAPAVTNGSSMVGYASGTGCNGDGWTGGGIGFTFLATAINGADTICANYDATKYTGISFDLWGSGQVRFEVCMSQLVEGNNADCHGVTLNATNSWARQSVSWASMSQRGFNPPGVAFDRSKIRKIQFLSLSADWNFAVDNLSFTN